MPENITELAVALKERSPTPEQQERRKFVEERNKRIQERGVPAPKSGTFGKAK